MGKGIITLMIFELKKLNTIKILFFKPYIY